ncbi:hypothetical protein LOK49_LG05G03768 [Camellia lanceoleosa]|uniref:Uncharacterized protein n=1 Tax=Camellia lanceoleosa TaxID=1840588 RepID=A0ACC0HN92_9ERIC|nr:hypothetical protein LOK49_LG05G03768 [Camellia lanceoleosa]
MYYIICLVLSHLSLTLHSQLSLTAVTFISTKLTDFSLSQRRPARTTTTTTTAPPRLSSTPSLLDVADHHPRLARATASPLPLFSTSPTTHHRCPAGTITASLTPSRLSSLPLYRSVFFFCFFLF